MPKEERILKWKRESALVAQLTAEKLGIAPTGGDDTTTTLTIAYNRVLHSWDQKEGPIMIGRLAECHIHLPPNAHQSVSRMHAIVLAFPHLGMYVVVDMGGLFGFDTLKRSGLNEDGTPKPCVSSRPNDRNVLVFAWDEIAIIKLGLSETIAINPKECLICFERPRMVTFNNCGHHVTCGDCTTRINACPLCREPVDDSNMIRGLACVTNVK
jgi:hypothetical protein